MSETLTLIQPFHIRITKKVGAGGMGEVYSALESRLNRQVALKLLPIDSAADQNADSVEVV